MNKLEGLMYFHFISDYEKGVKKKIYYQIKSLKKLKLDIKYTELRENKFYLNEKFIFNFFTSKNKIYKILRKIQENIIIIKMKDKTLYNHIKYLYIRNLGSTPIILGFYRFLKNNNIKIILEIPTYPYDNEIKNQSVFVKMDKYYRKRLYKYVDRIVTYSEDKEIWGIPCINISNGIDLEDVQLINKKEKNKEKIIFTSVSNCSFWHGIDRFLKSIEKYGEQENKKEIIFNIIGEGGDSSILKEIVFKNEYLSKVVKFQGFKLGKDLDDIYDETDIGIASLGRHRSGLHTMRALKNREYCAKGIPMIFSEDDPDLRDVPFVYHITPDEKLIDIEKLIDWYENINLEPKDIRKYAEQFSWDIQMKKVIDEIEKI